MLWLLGSSERVAPCWRSEIFCSPADRGGASWPLQPDRSGVRFPGQGHLIAACAAHLSPAGPGAAGASPEDF